MLLILHFFRRFIDRRLAGLAAQNSPRLAYASTTLVWSPIDSHALRTTAFPSLDSTSRTPLGDTMGFVYLHRRADIFNSHFLLPDSAMIRLGI